MPIAHVPTPDSRSLFNRLRYKCAYTTVWLCGCPYRYNILVYLDAILRFRCVFKDTKRDISMELKQCYSLFLRLLFQVFDIVAQFIG